MTKPLIIGTRGSELARRQTQLAVEALQARHGAFAHEIRVIRTAGDAHADIPLAEVNRRAGTQDKGVFIAALEDALASGEIDCAVHSLKDMPGALDPRFEIAAFLPRAPLGDVLVVKAGADPERLVVGTSSARRAQLVRRHWGGSAETRSLRGNVATRLRKLAESPELGAIILARAGLDRLGYPRTGFEVAGARLTAVDLSPDIFMPALGQGAIALEARKGDEATRAFLAAANDPDTAACVRCERAFLAALEADCSTPVAGFATVEKDLLMFRALYFTPSGQAIRLTLTGRADEAEEMGRRARAQLRERLA